jgi:hypothetical protein
MMGAKIIGKVRPGDQLDVSADATCETKGILEICNTQGWTKVDGVNGKYSKRYRGWAAIRFLRFTECDEDIAKDGP